MQLLSPREQLALGFVAKLYLNRLRSAPDVLAAKHFASEHGVPARYLECSLQQLVRAGILKSERGPKGGYGLAKVGQEITVQQVLDAIEVEGGEKHPAVCDLTENIVAPVIDGMAPSFRFQLAQTSIAALVTHMSGKGFGK